MIFVFRACLFSYISTFRILILLDLWSPSHKIYSIEISTATNKEVLISVKAAYFNRSQNDTKSTDLSLSFLPRIKKSEREKRESTVNVVPFQSIFNDKKKYYRFFYNSANQSKSRNLKKRYIEITGVIIILFVLLCLMF